MTTRIYSHGDNRFLSFYISKTEDFEDVQKFVGSGNLNPKNRVIRTLDGSGLEKARVGYFIVHVPASPENPIEVTRDSGTILYLRSGFLVFHKDEFEKWFNYIPVTGGDSVESKR